MMFLLLGCIPQTLLMQVAVQGEVTTSGSGELYAELHHAEGGTGTLTHPGGWLMDFTIASSGVYSVTLDVPVEEGSGLALYVWQDTDGDGVLCGLGQDEELAGAAVDAELGFAMLLDVTLAPSCAGPEVLIAEEL